MSNLDSRLVAATQAYVLAKEKKETAEDALSQAKAILEEANVALLSVMDGIGVRNFDMDDKKFYVKTTVSAKVAEGMQEQVVEWMKQDPEGRVLVKETCNAMSLGGFLAERLANGGAMPPKELVTDPMGWNRRSVTMQKLKEKKS